MKFFFLIFKISDFFGQIYLSVAGCGKWDLKNQNLRKILVISVKDTFCSGLFLYNFETYQNYLIKSTIKGINFTLFHVQPYTLELSMRHFQTPKDQGYLKLTQKFEKIDIAQPQKCPFFNPKNPLCYGANLKHQYDFSTKLDTYGCNDFS